MLVDGLVSQACAFAADQRLPAAEALQGRLLLAHTLRAHGQRLAQVGRLPP